MTTSAVIPQITFQGSSGSGTLGPFSLIKSGTPIYFTANSQIKVYRYDTTTDTAPTLLVEGTDYDLTGGPNAGSITLTSPQTGLLTAERLFVYREQPTTQTLDLITGGNFSAANLEARLDRTTEMIQELKREVQSGVRFSLFDTDNIPNTLPLSAAIDKLVYVSGTAAAPTLATIDSPANLLANIQLTADNITNINLVGSDLGGADTIGIVAADLDGDNNIGAVAAIADTLATNIADIVTVATALDDGTIPDLLDGQVGKVTTLAALQAYTPVNGQVMYMAGRASAGDGGGGVFRWDSSDLSTEVAADEVTSSEGDGGVYIAPASDATGASGAWVRITDGTIPVGAYGALENAVEHWADTTRVRIPSGTTTESVSASDPIVVPDGAIIEGDEMGALVQLTTTVTGTTEFFDVGNGVTFQDLSLNMTVSASQTAQIFKIGDDNHYRGLSIDGNVTDAGASASHIAHVYDFNDAATSRFWSIGNYIHDVGRVFLKSNSSAIANRHLRFIGDVYENIYTEVIALNTPHTSSEIRDVLIFGCTANERLGADVGAEAHFMGSASGVDLRFAFNCSMGDGDEIVHIEENAKRFVIIGNEGLFVTANSGIKITDNNAGGAGYLTPTHGIVSGNILVRSTRGSSTFGLHVVSDASGTAPAHEVILAHNVVSGWSAGGQTAEDPHRIMMSDNIIDDADIGLKVVRPSLTIRDNLLSDCDIGIQIASGGLVGHQIFTAKDASAYDGSSILLADPFDANSQIGGLMGWSVQIERHITLNGSNNLLIMPLGAALTGRLFVGWYLSNVAYRYAAFDITWDGTTLSGGTTLINAKGVGAVALVDVRNDGSGNLAVRLNNTLGSNQSNCRTQLHFQGMHLFA